MKTILTSALFVLQVSVLFGQQLAPNLPNITGQSIISSGMNGGPTLTNDVRFGSAVANIGDVNNDGVEDIVVGSHTDDNGGASTLDYGAVYICFMTSSKTVSSSVKISKGTQGIGNDISSLDYFGRAVAGIGDLNNDGVEDIAVGSYGDDITNYANSGSIYIIFLTTGGGVSSYTKIERGLNGGPTDIKTNSWFGISISSIGDINADGIKDLAVGGALHDGPSNGVENGAVWTLRMNTNGTVAGWGLMTKSTGGLPALANSDRLGLSLCGTGDLNGDGIPDLLVSSYLDDTYSSNTGALYLLYLNSSGTAASYKKYYQPFFNNIVHYTTQSSLGISVFVNDIDEDGQPEWFVGTNSDNYFFIISTDSSENIIGLKKYGSNTHWNHTMQASLAFAPSINTLNDIDGDGKKELIVGANLYDAPGLTNNGAVYVLEMDEVKTEVNIGEVYDVGKFGELSNDMPTLDASDLFGTAVCDIGDVNNDGYRDIAIGVPGDDDGATNAGAVYIVFLNANQQKISSAKINANTTNFTGLLEANDNFGSSIASAGDMDADGVPDLIVGATLDDDGVVPASATTNRGAIYIIYLNSTGTVKGRVKIADGVGGLTANSLSNNCQFGSAICNIGDVDNDGVTDLAVGAPLDDDGGNPAGVNADRGAVWVLLMNANETVKTPVKISDTQGDFTETFSANSVNFGMSVASIGDFNNDQVEDLVVGSPAMNSTGAVYILYLGTDGKVDGYQKINNANSNFPVTLKNGLLFGRSVATCNDLNGDGIKEIAIGQRGFSAFGQSRGAVWLTYPNSTGLVSEYTLLSDSTARFNEATGLNHYFGISLGVYTSGTNQHLFIGSSQHTENATANAGAVFKAGLVSMVGAGVTYEYVGLYKSLDGAFYNLPWADLNVKYNEEYFDLDSKVTYTIYDRDRTPVITSTVVPKSILFGNNQLKFNVGSLTHNKFYVLEITNQKNEVWKLRFKKSKRTIYVPIPK